MRIIIDGQEIRAVTLNSARGRDIIALQTETGWGLDELVAMSKDKTKHAVMNKVIEYLAEHNRGRFVTWDEILDRPLAEVVVDPGDDGVRDQSDQAASEDPTSAPTASQPAGAAAPVATARIPEWPSSTEPSDGSTSRSTDASSAS